ncbi:mediator of RNA polymerase II transcription subunit 27-like [Anneissia japonica]|uniref:mediator of RNA polymerase II transcription subunit 27-like n=1 Tax=Anneissia japonica TaxID=1529436 RepID=UPI00142581C3|nr:mediator of RNA polymerase II transcription subunit 27-like [Anneissia japonica]
MSDIHEKNSKAFLQAIEAIQRLRASVTNVFDQLKDGKKMPTDGNTKERAFLSELQAGLMLVTTEFEQFEKQALTLPKWTEVPPLGNTSLLSLDPITDRLSFYHEALEAYKWSDKMREHSNLSALLLSQSISKRSSSVGPHSNKRKRPPITSHAIAPDVVDAITLSIDQHFTDLTIQRIQVSPYVLQVTLSRTFQAIIVLRGLLIERVIVKATHENVTREDGSPDCWTPSKYLVFQKITDHVTATMLHYHYPNSPEIALKQFMNWLRSYNKLFSTPCKRCGKYLQDNLPPTHRDLRKHEPYHESCR